MRMVLTFGMAALGLSVSACSNPCEKLASAVCAKAKDPGICDQVKKDAKTSDSKQREHCQEQLEQVDEVVKLLEAGKQAREEAAKAVPPAQPAPLPAPLPQAPTEPGK